MGLDAVGMAFFFAARNGVLLRRRTVSSLLATDYGGRIFGILRQDFKGNGLRFLSCAVEARDEVCLGMPGYALGFGQGRNGVHLSGFQESIMLLFTGFGFGRSTWCLFRFEAVRRYRTFMDKALIELQLQQ